MREEKQYICGINCRGMTIVELMLAALILIVGGGALAGNLISSHVLAEQTDERNVALRDGSSVLERIHTTDFDDLLIDFPDGIPDGGASNDYEVIVGGYTLDSEEITVQHPTQTSSYLEIIVSVSWISRDRQRSITLSTVRTGGQDEDD